MNSRKYKFMISGGGTGGHIFPALSIADALKAEYHDAEFLFVGAKDRMEMQRVPAAGYHIEGLWISGIQRSAMWKNINFPFKLISSIMKCKRLIRKFKPDVVVGTGGFASGPLLYVAQKKNIPTVIQEQNSFPGITNKLLAKRANKICVAYDGLEKFFPKESLVNTGNPIRQKLIDGFLHAESSNENQNVKLLVLGGSLGARRINQQMLKCYEELLEQNISINWQCGKLYEEGLKTQVKEHPDLALNAFLTDMTSAYKEADIIISRAGAGTISELCLVGKPSILIPSPNVAEDHQTKNARAISDKNAALFLEEKNIEQLATHVIDLASNKELRESLGTAIKSLAKPKATQNIVAEIKRFLA